MARLLARRFVSPISVPGPRLLRFVRLAFVRRGGGRGRAVGFELPLVSFVDCLLCLILFLLTSFSADAESAERQKVPGAHNTQANFEAPVVAVTQRQILLDGVPAGSTQALLDAGRLTRLDDLFNQLKAKRELWRQLHPAEEFPGVVVLQIDRRVPSLVVKSAFQTAAYAGYPNVSFLVKQR
jgi:biopolymer transport protein ExbD